jgi:hypothetical protein
MRGKRWGSSAVFQSYVFASTDSDASKFVQPLVPLVVAYQRELSQGDSPMTVFPQACGKPLKRLWFLASLTPGFTDCVKTPLLPCSRRREEADFPHFERVPSASSRRRLRFHIVCEARR